MYSHNTRPLQGLLILTLSTLLVSLFIAAFNYYPPLNLSVFQWMKEFVVISLSALLLFWYFFRASKPAQYQRHIFGLKRVGLLILIQILVAISYFVTDSREIWQLTSSLNLLISGGLYVSFYRLFLLKRFSDSLVIATVCSIFLLLIAFALNMAGSFYEIGEVPLYVLICSLVGAVSLLTVALLRAQYKLNSYPMYEFLPVLLVLTAWFEVMALPGSWIWWSAALFQVYTFCLFVMLFKQLTTSATSEWQLFKNGFDLSNSAYFCSDHTGKVRFVNSAYRSLLDIDKGQNLQEIKHPLYTHPLADSMFESLKKTGSWQGETVLVSTEGRVVSVFAKLALIEIEGLTYEHGWFYDIHEKIAYKQNENAILEKLENLSFSLMEKQEDERRFFAKELHDEIGQGLTLLKLQLQLPKPDKDLINTVLGELIDKVRNLSLNLRPAILDDMGLASALSWMSERQRRFSQLAITEEIDQGLPRLNDKIEISVFRIAQEAFTNIHKYSHADHVLIGCSIQGDYLQLILEDNGVGFDVDAKLNRANKGQSLGLLSIKERAFLVNGLVHIDSTPEHGTRIELRVPLSGQHDEGGTDEVIA